MLRWTTDQEIELPTYDTDSVIAATQFDSGVTVANTGGTLEFVSGPDKFHWTYTDNAGDTADSIAETGSFPD